MSFLVIDGSQGEGGGQVLRTSLALSILTNTPIDIVNIRAKRTRPGLLRQHLTCVQAAQAISQAQVEGVALGAQRLRFTPGKVLPGDYQFSIGTAGSTVLVAQTLLPVLMLAKAPSTILLEGGTHNGLSPSLCFFQESYLAALISMGIHAHVDINSLGFYPAGGGRWQLTIEPSHSLKSLTLLTPAKDSAREPKHCMLKALMSDLPDSIGHKEVATARAALNWQSALGEVVHYQTQGPGNSFQAKIQGQTFTHVFEQVGTKGVSAERVAARCAAQVRALLSTQAAVEAHLADQLLVPMALAGGGEFTTTEPSLHTRTNIDVIQQFLDINIQLTEETQGCWRIKVSKPHGWSTKLHQGQ